MAREYPGYVATAFLGHSTTVANKLYWQVTGEDCDGAVQVDEKATQNPTQHLHARPRTEQQRLSAAHEKNPILQVPAAFWETMRTGLVGEEGLQEQKRLDSG